jgi:hypothetical protein
MVLCVVGMGKAQESIARAQERYIARATSSWLESLERSLAQMKEYSVQFAHAWFFFSPRGCSD